MQDEALGQLIRAKARISDPAKHLTYNFVQGNRMCSYAALAMEIAGRDLSFTDIEKMSVVVTGSTAFRTLDQATMEDGGVCCANNTLPHAELMARWDKAIAVREAIAAA